MRTLFVILCLSIGVLAANDAPRCYRELQTDFFRYEFVGQALSLHRISQSSWDPIHRALVRRSRGVPATVKLLARRMDPDPLQRPFQRKAAEQLLYDVLFEVFAEVMDEFDVVNPYDIREMFNYIRDRQKGLIDECLSEGNRRR